MKHGKRKTRLYSIWNNMINRCYCESHEAYPNYGGRGIGVCTEWHSFLGFAVWADNSNYSSAGFS